MTAYSRLEESPSRARVTAFCRAHGAALPTGPCLGLSNGQIWDVPAPQAQATLFPAFCTKMGQILDRLLGMLEILN